MYYLVLLIFNGFIVCTYYGDLNYASVSCHAECGSALGIANRKIIKDEDIRASSKSRLQYDANNGRLNGNSSWCSNHTDSKPYLEIDLEKPYKITYVATQGNRNWNYWVSKYIVSHNSARSSFIEYREEEREKVYVKKREILKSHYCANKKKPHSIDNEVIMMYLELDRTALIARFKFITF